MANNTELKALKRKVNTYPDVYILKKKEVHLALNMYHASPQVNNEEHVSIRPLARRNNHYCTMLLSNQPTRGKKSS